MIEKTIAGAVSREEPVQVGFNQDWMYQCRTAGDVDDLPAPRLQLTLLDNTQGCQKWQVALLYRDLKGFLVRAPLDYSELKTGSKLDVEALFASEVPGNPASQALLSALPALMMDLCHTHLNLGFPAYVVLDDHQIRINRVWPIPEAEVLR